MAEYPWSKSRAGTIEAAINAYGFSGFRSPEALAMDDLAEAARKSAAVTAAPSYAQPPQPLAPTQPATAEPQQAKGESPEAEAAGAMASTAGAILGAMAGGPVGAFLGSAAVGTIASHVMGQATSRPSDAGAVSDLRADEARMAGGVASGGQSELLYYTKLMADGIGDLKRRGIKSRGTETKPAGATL